MPLSFEAGSGKTGKKNIYAHDTNKNALAKMEYGISLCI